MQGQIHSEYFITTKDGVQIPLIDMEGWTVPPYENWFQDCKDNPSKARFVTRLFTSQGPDEEPEQHTIVFWGKMAHQAKQVLMDHPRAAYLYIKGGRVSDPYQNKYGDLDSSISINWNRQVRVLEHRDYALPGKSFKEIAQNLTAPEVT